MYKILIDKAAEKELKKLPKHILKLFKQKVDILVQDPFSMSGVDTIKNPVALGYAAEYYRIRIADYRMIYSIQNDILTILVLDIAHRSRVYRKK